MASKYCALFVIAFLAAKGHCAITEVQLEDLDVNHTSNPLLSRSFSIPKFFLDVLQSCHIQFPNGIIYEVFPNKNLPANTFEYLEAVEPFNSCGVGMREVSSDLSGSYELIAVTAGWADQALTLTRQRYNVRITYSDIEWPNRMRL